MAISQAMCTSFKGEILLGVHDFRFTGGDTFKLALYTASASLDASTTAYTATGEVSSSGTNYTAGGATLTNAGVNTASATGFTDFDDVVFAASTITARGALIYNTTPSAQSAVNTPLTNPAVAVLDFGADRSSSSGDFLIIFPAPTSATAIIRIG